MKKLIYNLILLLTAFCLPAVMFSQTIVQIGNQNSSCLDLPMSMTHNYSVTQQIYTANEIGMAGTISSVGFCYRNNQQPLSMPGIRMYLMHTTKTMFENDTDIVPIDEATLVYEGDLVASDTGWVTLPFSTTFEYNGVSNLLMCMYDATDGYSGGYRFAYTNGGRYSTISYYSNFIIPNINDLSSFIGSKSRSGYHSSIQLGITPATGQCIAPSSVTISDITNHEASISWIPGDNETSWQICINGDEDNLIDISTTSYNLTGLAGETSYNVNVRAVCSEDGHSNWSEIASFTTLTACFVPANLAIVDKSATTATIRWDAGGEETAWQICINNDENNIIDVSDSEYTITGLIPNTSN